MNRVELIGRLTRDPEVKYNESGFCIATFTLAIDRVKGKGERDTDFPRVRVLGKQAENCEVYIHKGSKVAVEGCIQTGSYVNRDGDKVYTTEVLASRVEFLSSYGRQEQQEPTAKDDYGYYAQPEPEPKQESFIPDDEPEFYY